MCWCAVCLYYYVCVVGLFVLSGIIIHVGAAHTPTRWLFVFVASCVPSPVMSYLRVY